MKARGAWGLAALLVIAALVGFAPPAEATSFPVIEIANGGFDAASVSSHPVPLPTGGGGIDTGDLLVVVFCYGGAVSATAPGGWTGLTFFTSQQTQSRMNGWYRVADGSEGTTLSITTSVALRASYQTYRVVGQASATFIESDGTQGDGLPGALVPDPPALNPAGWDVENTLWIALACIQTDIDSTTITAVPASYTAIRAPDRTQSAGGNAVQGAYRQNAVASENPTTFSLTTPDHWQAGTIAIEPRDAEPLSTLAATQVRARSARLWGNLNVLFSNQASVQFEWGDTPSLGNTTAIAYVSAQGAFSAVLPGLEPETTYYFRAVSEEIPSGYTGTGGTLSFMTLIDTEGPIVDMGFSVFWVVLFLTLLTAGLVMAARFGRWGKGGGL